MRQYCSGLQSIQLLNTATANRNRRVSQTHGGSSSGPARTAAGGVVVVRPLLTGQGGASAGAEGGLGHTQLTVGRLVGKLVISGFLQTVQ